MRIRNALSHGVGDGLGQFAGALKPAANPIHAIAFPKGDHVADHQADHQAVNKRFVAFEQAHSDAGNKALVAEIFSALNLHDRIEKSIFHPSMQSALKGRLKAHRAQAHTREHHD